MQQNNNTYQFYGPEDIKRYLGGSMSAQEMHDMEKAALKDPMLADAIDGFRNADATLTDKHLNDIRAAITGSAQKENRVVPITPKSPNQWWRWAAAACALGVLATGAWWLYQKQNGPAAIPVATLTQDIRVDTPISSFSRKPESAAKIPVIASHNSVAKKTATKIAVAPPAKSIHSQPSVSVKEEAKAADAASASGQIAFNNESPENIRMRGIASTHTAPALNFNPAARPIRPATGKITDEAGNPVPSATISGPGNMNLLSKKDGSFVLPAADSALKISVSSVGYKNATATLAPGETSYIKLAKNESDLNETVVIGYGSQKKKALTGAVGDYRVFQKQTRKALENEVIYPEEGWAHFYEKLSKGLGVDKSKATKTLQIKFTVDENGDPVDFEIVESPDEILARKTIEFIKKVKWKNFKLGKNAVVKIEVN